MIFRWSHIIHNVWKIGKKPNSRISNFSYFEISLKRDKNVREDIRIFKSYLYNKKYLVTVIYSDFFKRLITFTSILSSLLSMRF